MAIVHKTRTQLVSEEIRKKILSGEYAPGAPLRQAALAEELNVSRIPIREALMQLESEGLVHFEAHKGATVSELSVDQVDEVFEVRALLECDVLKRAIPRLTDDDFKRAEELLEEMDDAMKNGDMIAATGELNAQFHHVLYAPSGRKQTLELIESLYKNCSRFVRMHILLAGGIDTAPDEHKELLTLCREGKKAQAATFLKKHILSARDDVKAYLVKSEKEKK